jgi:hypothetical protein
VRLPRAQLREHETAPDEAGSFDAQDAITEVLHGKTLRAEERTFFIRPTSFGADGEDACVRRTRSGFAQRTGRFVRI